jgi:hypothetical protein
MTRFGDVEGELSKKMDPFFMAWGSRKFGCSASDILVFLDMGSSAHCFDVVLVQIEKDLAAMNVRCKVVYIFCRRLGVVGM